MGKIIEILFFKNNIITIILIFDYEDKHIILTTCLTILQNNKHKIGRYLRQETFTPII